MITTPNLGLNVLDLSDPSDIRKIGENMELIDNAIIIPCSASYNATAKRHQLSHEHESGKLSEVFSVRFVAAASFTQGDKVYIGGEDYTPTYTDNMELPVCTGCWTAGAVVSFACVKSVKKAFVGTSLSTQFEEKANCYNKIFSSGNIVDIIVANPCGSFRVDTGVTGMPKDTFWIVTTFTGFNGYLYAVAVALDNTKKYSAAYNNGTIPKFSGWKETPLNESGKWVPTLQGSTIAGTPVYTATGNYYKIGDVVLANAHIKVSSVGGMDGDKIVVGSLPYAVKTKLASGVNYMDIPPDSTSYSNSTNIALTNIYVFAKLKNGTDFDVFAIYERG